MSVGEHSYVPVPLCAIGLTITPKCILLETLVSGNPVGRNCPSRLTTKDHLPFERTFLADEPEYLPKDNVAEGYRKWVAKYGIVRLVCRLFTSAQSDLASQNIWLSTTLLSGSWDVEKEIWELKISRDGEESLLNCSYVVFAVGGGSQVPVTPVYPGRVSG